MADGGGIVSGIAQGVSAAAQIAGTAKSLLTPTPKAKSPGPVPSVNDTANSKEAQAQAEQRRQLAGQGASSDIGSNVGGVSSDEETTAKVLLGGGY